MKNLASISDPKDIVTKEYVDARCGGSLPIGTIIEYSGGSNDLPTGYMLCDGSAISRTTYSQLFNIIGTTYGSGDGSTTFNLPNLKGRVAVGFDSSDSDFDTLGESGGEKTHTLTIDEMPAHNHNTDKYYNTGIGANNFYGSNATGNHYTNPNGMSNAGGGQAHNNLQPYLVVNYIIKVSQTTSTQAQVVDGYSESTTDAYSANYVNNVVPKIFKMVWGTTYTLQEVLAKESAGYEFRCINNYNETIYNISSFNTSGITFTNPTKTGVKYYTYSFTNNTWSSGTITFATN